MLAGREELGWHPVHAGIGTGGFGNVTHTFIQNAPAPSTDDIWYDETIIDYGIWTAEYDIVCAIGVP